MATKKKPSGSPVALAELIRGIFDVLSTAIERFGWPGATVLLAYVFIELHASVAQKREFIELLLHPEKGSAAFAVLLVLSALVFFAQDRYWKQRESAKDREIKRLADWKSEQQQRQIGRGLHHTKNEEAGRSPKIPTVRTRRQRKP